jgi:hypothetical protein
MTFVRYRKKAVMKRRNGFAYPNKKQYKMQISLYNTSDAVEPYITSTYFEKDKYQTFNYDQADPENLASIDEKRYDNNFQKRN